jgi:hypothetical protein
MPRAYDRPSTRRTLVAKRDTSEQVRRFGPLSFLLVAAAIAFIVLPSTLTLPNPSPTSQEEIAPVPPTQSKINPPVSNFTTLNSGTTGNGLGDGGGGGDLPLPPPPKLPPGLGVTPEMTYQCVAGRQTEDPLSPTCVPFYEGTNPGATYQGVTKKEVRIVMYFDAADTTNTSQGVSHPPYDTITDVDDPPKPREHPAISSVRAWEKFFYKRYAAYNRKVHLFVQFGSANRSTAGTQTQDAAKAYTKVHPFAIINYISFGNGDYYNNYMAEHGVLIFGSVAVRGASFYKQYGGKQWGYKPPFEYGAAQFANFVCKSLKGKTVADAGQGTLGGFQNGSPRKYALLYTTDKGFPGLTDEALLAKDLMKKQCGVETVHDQHYAVNGFTIDPGTTPDYAVNIANTLRDNGITTVLWPAGHEGKISGAMNTAHYYPEIITGDDDQQASISGSQFQDPTVWAHAWNVTSQTLDPAPNERICAQEYRTVDTTAPQSDVQSFACDYYNDLRMLYTGIQVAGPNLTPQTINQGYHAIPVVESTNPQVPTCYYLVDDYTCVKDSAIQHWDSAGQAPGSSRAGCWRMVGNGKRFLPGKFPTTNLDAMKNNSEVCNNFAVFISYTA